MLLALLVISIRREWIILVAVIEERHFAAQ
ncbi:MAG: hypothetical protein EHM21_07660 [Chloroflexi bacterium]|nr:MAG: hypothetical protein EHM21_07660 [Chloroflexota bacterium]